MQRAANLFLQWTSSSHPNHIPMSNKCENRLGQIENLQPVPVTTTHSSKTEEGRLMVKTDGQRILRNCSYSFLLKKGDEEFMLLLT